MGQEQEIRNAFMTALIDGSVESNLAYKPQLISNNSREGQKVISTIEDELSTCDAFFISVAFITLSGLTPLLEKLKELESKNIPGKILTTDYLTFSDPKALSKLHGLNNIDLKMYCSQEAENGFHTKGYIFRKGKLFQIIIGSSNMTLNALTVNQEWNAKIASLNTGDFAQKVYAEFQELWNSKYSKTFEEFYEDYRSRFEIARKQREIAKKEAIISLPQYTLQPNEMQRQFVQNLAKIVQEKKNKALLISATGTGKTYASAFGLRDVINPRKALFIVHREQIAKQAMESYQRVFGRQHEDGTPLTYGLLSGNRKDLKSDLLFSTMQMMAKAEIHDNFAPDEFDVIVLDEVHHAGAESYQKIMSYFKPKLWLGMTASPDTTHYDIYSIFDHNIAYEIRLQQALEENLLCPFHYFGITDLEINGEVFDDTTGVRNFRYLVSDDRVDYIIQQAEYYGHCGDRVKGLIFCSRKKEAEELSRRFNLRGYHTAFLSSEDDIEKRQKTIVKLVGEDSGETLDYIFTVDIFNEGVDIQEINQVIMLRPTESPIVFIQQLGRGLRKYPEKEYVVVLDFIGNYMNNFMIPIALSGDRTYNKDNIRRYLREGSRVIPGASTIHFDEISKKRIFRSIDKMTTKRKMLSDKYDALKYRLGRVPTVVDFYEYGEIDPMILIDYAGSYDQFVRLIDKDYSVSFSSQEEKMIEYVSQLLVNGQRPHELLMLKILLKKGTFDRTTFKDILEKEGVTYREADYSAACCVLTKEFINSPSDKERFKTIKFIDLDSNESTAIRRSQTAYRAALFADKLSSLNFRKEMMLLIEYGLKRYHDIYAKHDEDNLVLYEKYSRKDVCRLLNWEHDDSSTIYGYRIKYQTCPIFVTYEKNEDISDSTKYEDQFVNEDQFSWLTRNRVTLESQESQQLIHFRENGLKIYLFVKKSDGEGTDFYYMGKVDPKEWHQTTIVDNKGKTLPIMNIIFKMEHSVRQDIYEYFTS